MSSPYPDVNGQHQMDSIANFEKEKDMELGEVGTVQGGSGEILQKGEEWK